jgi:glycosyltransferase involved in cell wall biosynthesis
MAHNLEGLMAACARVTDPSIAFVCIGDGAAKRALKEVVAQQQLRNVLLLDPVSKDEIVRYWSIIDVALVPLRKDPVFTSVIPSKIFEAAAMGKPILLGVEGQAKEIVDLYDAGVCFEPDNTDDFLANVALLHRDRALYERLSRNCQSLAADYDREALAEKMYGYLAALVERTRHGISSYDA